MSTPARTASSYKFGQIGLRQAFSSWIGARALLAVACGTVLVAGCNQVGSGLNSNLPPAGGGGLLSFTSVAMPDGVAGRAYSKVAVTTVETQAKTNFPISPTVASGTAPLASCTVSAGTLPPGMNAALTVDSTGAGCVISGTPSAAAAGNTYQFTIQALDSNSPPRAAAQTFTMKVRSEFTVTAPAAVVANALPAGVQGRTYGQIAGNAAAMTATTNLSATTGNGAVGAKNYCALSVTPALATLTLTQVAGTNSCQLQGTGALAAAGSYKVTIALTDNPIVDPETNLPAVSANTIAATSNATLNVAAPLKIIAQADGVSPTPPAAVQGRAYGTGSGCSGGACLPLTYVSSGGLPSVEPADSYLFSSSAALSAAGINCGASVSSAVAKTTCSGTAGAAGTANFSVTVDDPGNLATPSGSASATTASVSGLSLTVDSALNLAVSPDPAANPAVQNRAYGTGIGCTGAGGACVAPTYTPSGGLGTYSFNISGSAPSGITCAANGGNTAVVCSGTVGAAATSSTFGVAASDVANASTPSATTPTVSKTLTVNGALTLAPPASLPPAVNGRAFGTGAGCSGGNCVPAVFTISGGLGTYSASATVVSAPGAWTCPLTASNYNCSSTGVVSGTPTLSITASDGASATTPGATTASANVAVTVDVAMAVTPLGGAAPDAVTGRSYGSAASGCSGGACLPLKYAVSGGLGNYQAGTLAVADSASDSLPCAVASLTYSCSSGAINGNATSNAAIAMTALESGNTSTPGGTATDVSRTLTIQPAISLTPAAFAIAVNARSYGIGATCGAAGNVTCLSAQFAISGGLGGYAASRTPSSAPGTWNCVLVSTNYDCSTSTVSATGPYPASANLSLSTTDTGNASTPSGSSSTSTGTLTVNGPLTLTAQSGLPQAVNGSAFGTGTGCSGSGGNCVPATVFVVSGGLGGYTANPTPSVAPGVWSCALAGSNYNCSTSLVAAIGPFPATPNLSLSTNDTANNSTPSGSSGTSTASVTVNGPLTITAPAGLQNAVNGRAYGSGTGCPSGGTACLTVNFAISGGLSGYSAANITSAPGTWSCTLVGGNYQCGTSSISNATTSTLTLSATDKNNASAPTDTSNSASVTLTIVPEMAITPPGTVNAAVTGRSYGVGSGCGGSCSGLVYSVANGLGNYGTGFLTAGTDTFSCSLVSPTYTCTKAAISSAPGTNTLSMSISENGNQYTPTHTVTDTSDSLTVDAPLTIAASQGPTWQAAVQGRSYGNNGTTNQVAASGGISPYTYSRSGFPSTITCTPLVATSLATVCSSTDVTDPATSYTPTVGVADSSNGSTPAASSPATSTNSLTVDAQLSVNSITLPNALQNYPYPTNSAAATLTSTGGLGGLTWAAPGSPAGGCTPTGSFPPSSNPTAFAINGATGAITGTAISASTGAGQYNFVACVTDTQNSMTPAGSANSASLTIDVIAPLAFVAESGDVHLINTQSKTSVTTISTSPAGLPYGVAISPSGRYAYVTLSDTDQLAIYDTITHTQVGSFVSLTSGCIPHGVGATGTYIFVACNGLDEVDVVNASTLVKSTIATAVGGSPEGVAVSPDGTRVYVTLSTLNKMFVIDSSGTPSAKTTVNLPSGVGTTPLGIVIAQNCGCSTGNVAYIAEENPGSPDGVVVQPVGGDSFSGATTVTISSDGSAFPAFVAVTPDNARVYVTLNGPDTFAVIDNSKATPSQLSGSPFALTGTGTLSLGVTIPPLAGSTYNAFISEGGTNKVGVINDSATTPADDGSPISVGSAPELIASIPAPQ